MSRKIERGITTGSPERPHGTINANSEEFWPLQLLRMLTDQHYRLKQYQKRADALAQKHGKQ